MLLLEAEGGKTRRHHVIQFHLNIEFIAIYSICSILLSVMTASLCDNTMQTFLITDVT